MPSVLRRYTPPTCTLEIMAQGSALSRWTDRQVLKQVKFRLHFDDPRIPKDKRQSISGDRQQLEALCQVVTDYVQTMLYSPPAPSSSPLSLVKSRPSTRQAESRTDITITPQGLLNHELHLGTLATPESGPMIALSVTQLADLSTALDAYQADALVIPTLAQPKGLGAIQGWWQVAAIAVFVMGTTISAVQFLPSQMSMETVSESDAAPRGDEISPESSASAPANQRPNRRQRDEEEANASDDPLTDDLLTDDPDLDSSPADDPRRSEGRSRQGAQVPPAPTPRDSSRDSARSRPDQPPQEPAIASESAPSTLRVPNAGQREMSPSAEQPDLIEPFDLDDFSPEERGAPRAPITPGTAFDRLPQVSEVRDYFQQTWTPPSDLNQLLEYRLSINSSGTLQSVTPLGQPSRDYLDSTAMPGSDQPFVSPTPGQSLNIRLVLSPTGSVQTFLEGEN
ncbi:MAG: DUF4335 domain-containing protein [Leptolyngbya sp. DLM2.Bin15]|nr:MAG: DUF4335 domain-containing protein [Leptolyngbya sp. DLM2.Bin15]